MEEKIIMKVLYYTSTTSKKGEQLQEAIESVVKPGNTEIYRDFESLCKRLRRQTYVLDVSILFAKNKSELMGFLSIKNLLFDLRIILILPDGEKETITKGHMLFPRFLTYGDNDFEDVAAVLRKMFQKKTFATSELMVS